MNIKRKVLCFIGWHQWTWKFRSALTLNAPIPFHAKCSQCGKPYSTYTVSKPEIVWDPEIEKHINKCIEEEIKSEVRD